MLCLNIPGEQRTYLDWVEVAMEGEGLVMGEEERVGWDWEGVVREERVGEVQARGGLHKRARRGQEQGTSKV